MTLTTITTYHENGKSFKILQADDGFFWGIESKYIKNNKLLKEFNGATGNRRKTVKECINQISFKIKFDAMIDSGLSVEEATIAIIALMNN